MNMTSSMCLIAMGVVLSGCTAAVQRVGIAILYKKADLPSAQVHFDIPYEADADAPKHRLDLFVPPGANWPVLIFVYGGSWTEGDKSLRVGGADVYGNIGRFYAAHGIGVAVINYRLLPTVLWREQIADVAQATAWVHSHIAEYGGDPQRMFIGGHSAGAQLVTRVALDPEPLARVGLSPAHLCGVIPVSGAGFDLTDEKTYALGESPAFFAQRFDTGKGDWQRDASPVTYARPGAPPFLLLYCGGETKSLKRQSQRLSEVLSRNGIPNQTVIVPGQSHARIVLTLSRPDKTAGPAILDFIRNTKCPQLH